MKRGGILDGGTLAGPIVTARGLRLLPLALGAGCAYIGSERLDARFDPDGDGVSWPYDCDDEDARIGPASAWYAHADADGYGAAGQSTLACEGPAGTVANDDDCDDSDGEVHPGAGELCDGVDNDCDALVDDADDPPAHDATTWYEDGDGDGFGDPDTELVACEPDSGQVADGSDCDDSDGTVHPGAEDACGDGIDGDCSGGGWTCDPSLSSAAAKLVGAHAGEYVGSSLAGAGDLDGDGRADFAVVAKEASDLETEPGAYLVYQSVSGTAVLADVAIPIWADPEHGLPLGVVAGGGRADDDALPDLLIGAPSADALEVSCGAVYVVTQVDLDTGVDLADAAHYLGENSLDHAGSAVAWAGDMDGDGLDEALVGASEHDEPARNAGVVYVLPGGTPQGGPLAEAAWRQYGENSGDYAGRSVAGAGDVDGDGLADALIGAPSESTAGGSAGAAYVLLGPVTGTRSLGDADAKLLGEADGDTAGFAVAGAGDTNQDGLDDLLVSAECLDTAIDDVGGAYLVRGPVAGTTSLADAQARLVARAAREFAGSSVAGGGDLDGDGGTDLLVGSERASMGGYYAGAAYLVRGTVSGTFELTGAHARLVGESAGDQAGSAVAIAGDLDGDGMDDVLVGAYLAAVDESAEGAVYVITSPVDR